MIRLDISQGVDPLPVWRDILTDEKIIRCEGFSYSFIELPFTLKETTWKKTNGKDGTKMPCVDKNLLLKHRHKALKVVDLRTLEVVKDLG
jgi:hypothetical protein